MTYLSDMFNGIPDSKEPFPTQVDPHDIGYGIQCYFIYNRFTGNLHLIEPVYRKPLVIQEDFRTLRRKGEKREYARKRRKQDTDEIAYYSVCPYPAGWIRGNTRIIRHRRKEYTAAQLVFEWCTGSKPRGRLFHINGDSLDTHIDNLRSESRMIRTGRKKPFKARVMVAGESYYLGSFSTEEEARDCESNFKKLVGR